MNPEGVRKQIWELIERLVTASISVKQFNPSIKIANDGFISIAPKPSTAISLKNAPYSEVYAELDSNDAYNMKLIDGGLLTFQYLFNSAGTLLKHRVAYFPNPILPTLEDAPALYEKDELYGDIVGHHLVKFPIRFDYAPKQFCDVIHPSSHMTLGQYESCRIPVIGPVSPHSFGMFIVRNFYCRAYMRNKNTFDRHMHKLDHPETISAAERRISHLVPGR